MPTESRVVCSRCEERLDLWLNERDKRELAEQGRASAERALLLEADSYRDNLERIERRAETWRIRMIASFCLAIVTAIVALIDSLYRGR